MTVLPMIDDQIRDRLNHHEHHPQLITGDCAECEKLLSGSMETTHAEPKSGHSGIILTLQSELY